MRTKKGRKAQSEKGRKCLKEKGMDRERGRMGWRNDNEEQGDVKKMIDGEGGRVRGNKKRNG